MTFGEYIHASKHVPLGCSTMEECEICRVQGLTQSLGASDTSDEKSDYFSKSAIMKIIIFATVSKIIGDVILTPYVIPAMKRFLGSK